MKLVHKDTRMNSWKLFFSDKINFITFSLFALTTYAFMVVNSSFLLFAELRDGYVLEDYILNRIPPINVSIILFTITYLAIILVLQLLSCYYESCLYFGAGRGATKEDSRGSLTEEQRWNAPKYQNLAWYELSNWSTSSSSTFQTFNYQTLQSRGTNSDTLIMVFFLKWQNVLWVDQRSYGFQKDYDPSGLNQSIS